MRINTQLNSSFHTLVYHKPVRKLTILFVELMERLQSKLSKVLRRLAHPCLIKVPQQSLSFLRITLLDCKQTTAAAALNTEERAK